MRNKFFKEILFCAQASTLIIGCLLIVNIIFNCIQEERKENETFRYKVQDVR